MARGEYLRRGIKSRLARRYKVTRNRGPKPSFMATRGKRAKALTNEATSSSGAPAFRRVANAFANKPAVTFMEGKGFGSRALRVNGKIFAMLSSRGQYVVKLPAARVNALVSSGTGQHFDAGKGKPMREWLAISGRVDLWMSLAKEAYQFVSGSLSGGDS